MEVFSTRIIWVVGDNYVWREISVRRNRKYLVAVALLAVLAVVFGLAGTVAPVSEMVSPKQESSSDSATHWENPPIPDERDKYGLHGRMDAKCPL